MMNRLFSNVLQRLKPSNHGSNGSWESFAGPFILFDERLNVVKANQAARRLFSSYLVEDAVGKNLADIIPDIKETGRYDEYLKVIKTGSPFFASDVVPTSVFGDVRLSVVAFKVGKGLGMVVGDTSRVGKIKAVLEESEAKYRTILETSLDGIYQVDTSGRLTFVNDAFADIFGYKTEELLGKQFSSLLDAKTLVKVAGMVAGVISGKNVKGEVPVIHKDGHKVMVDFSATPLRVRGKIAGLTGMLRDVTERKKAEDALRESEERFRHVLENSLDMIYWLNLKTGEYDYVSPSSEKVMGYTSQEMVGLGFRETGLHVHPDDWDIHVKNMLNLLEHPDEKDKYSTIEYRFKHRKLGYRWMSDCRSVIYDADNTAIALVGALRDVTERKEAEEAIRESEERYKALVENAYDVINVIRRDGTIAYRSPASAYVPGLKIEDYTGMSGFEWVHPDDILKCMNAFAEVMEKPGAVVHIELRTKYVDDSWHTAEANATNLLDNKAVQGIVVHWHDITERKRAEQTLQESEERFRNVLDNSLDMVYRLNLQTGTYDYVSPSTEKILGYSPEEFVAFTIEKGRSLTHPDDLARLDENVIELVTSKAGTASSIEYRIKHKEPGYRWVSDSRSVVYDDGNNPVAVVGNLRDITEHKKAEEELRESEKKFRTVLENSRDAMCQVNLKTGNYDYISPAGSRLLGFSLEELGEFSANKATLNTKSVIHPDDYIRVKEYFIKLVSSEVEDEVVSTVEYRLKNKTLGYRWVSDANSVLRDENNVPVAIVGSARDVTERKIEGEAVRESEERYRALVDTAGLAGEGIMIAERNTEGEAVIVFANGQLANILGYEKKEELIGMFGRSLFLPGDRIWLRDRHKRRRKGEELTNHYGVMAFRKDGSMVPIEVSMGAMKYQGKTATVVYVRDVSDRKKAEEALRETRDYLENLLNFASAPIVVWDPEFRITRFNRAFEHLTGYKAGEIIGRELRILFPQASRDKSLNEISRTLTGEHWESVEIPILCKDGEIKLVLWNSSNVYAGDGVTLLATIAQGIDITERKQAQEKLRESEERFRSLIENALDVIVIVDADAKIVYASPSVERVLGYKPKELIGKDGLSYAHPDDAANAINILGKMEKNHDAPVYVQLRIKHKDGLWRIVEAVGKNMLDNPSVSGIVVNYRDVTERETAHRELVKHTRRVEALHSIAETASQTLEMEELLDTALGKVLEVMDADAGCIYLLDVVEKELVLKTCKGVSEESISQISTIKLGKKNMGKMLQWNGEIIALQEIFGDTAMSLASESLNGAQIQSFAVAPFAVRGQFYGLIAVGNHSHCEISLADVDLLRAVGNQIGVGTQNAVLFEEVRALIRETMEAQEKERERVCLEVHDGVAQTLVSAFQFLQTMEATMPDDKQNKQLLAKATAQVRQAIQESREVINTLQPATLKDLGLVATLRQEMRNLGKETGLRIEFKSDDIRLPKDIETGLYRIIHEAVVNARKHAGCNHLRIRIHDVDGRLKVEVKDWGKGFDQASLDRARRRGTGLFSIHKRAEILKGTCDIHSKPGQGTTVNVEIPMSTVALK